MGYFGFPEAYRQVHDGFSLQSCAMAAAQAIEDREVGINHLPNANDNSLGVILDYAIGFEQAFADRINVMDCPSAVQPQLAEMRRQHGLLLEYLQQIKADDSVFDGQKLNLRTYLMQRSIAEFTAALAELLPKPETNSSPSSS